MEGQLSVAVPRDVDCGHAGGEIGMVAILDQSVDLDRLDRRDFARENFRQDEVSPSGRRAHAIAHCGASLHHGRIQRMSPDDCTGFALQCCSTADVIGMAMGQHDVLHIGWSFSQRTHGIEDFGCAARKAGVQNHQAFGSLQDIDVDQPREHMQVAGKLFHSHGIALQ